jgi:hypothetical protein
VPTVLAHEQKQALFFFATGFRLSTNPLGDTVGVLNVCTFPACVFPERLNMNAKTLAHGIQSGLNAATGLDIKRAHVHELIASAFGCGSHAAMLSRGVLCPMPSALAQRQRLDEPSISRRACEL